MISILGSDLKTNFVNMSDFESTFWTRVRFWTKFFATCRILSVLYLQFANFSCVHQNIERSGNVLMYGVGSVSRVVLLG